MTDTKDRRRGLTIFRAGDAPFLHETGMMSTPVMRPGVAEQIADGISSLDDGQEVRVLFGKPGDTDGPSLVYAWFKPHYPLPRHSHDVDCLYYVVAGSAVLGSQVLRAGDGFFAPAGAPYQYDAGPEGVEVLEFRHARAFDMQIVEDDPQQWRAMFATAVMNADGWAAIDAPPAR